MKYLTEEWWSTFEGDGILFEKLCRKLLECMSETNIFKTKQTRDGGRDLVGKVPVLQDDYCIIWGECKYHTKNLSLQKVSSTLVMAYLNDVNFLYFFSYSPVNSKFEQHITDFCDKAKIKHYTYDDIRLEAILLQYQEEAWFDTFFRGFHRQKDYLLPSGIEITSHLKRSTKDQYSDSFEQEFCINETFQFQIYLTNKDVQYHSDVSVHLEKGDALKYVEVVDTASPQKYIKNVHLAPCSTVLVTFKLRTIRYAPVINLPQIRVMSGDNSYEINKKIRINWLAEVPLIGGHYSNSLQTIDHQFVNRTDGTVLEVYGRSGCGKSRLLNEISHIYDKYKYTLISFNCETQSIDIDTIARTIVSQIEHLPDCFTSALSEEAVRPFKKSQLQMAYQVLYDKNYFIQDHQREVLSYIAWLLNRKHTLILFDNFQVLQNTTIEFLREIIKMMYGQVSKSTILLCFNLDYVYPDSLVDKFYHQLLAWSAKSPQNCLAIGCEDFTTDNSKLYLKSCIQPLVREDQYLYDLSFEKIIKQIGTNPFALQQTLLLLRQKNIIALTAHGNFYFADIESFDNTLNNLSDGIKGVLSAREAELLSMLSEEETVQYTRLMSLLVFFQILPVDICRWVIKNGLLIERLKRLGFLRIEDDKHITFYHNYFFIFYRNNEVYRCIEENDAICVINTIESLKLDEAYFAPYFILCYHQNKLTSQLSIRSANYMLDRQIPDVFLVEYCEIMLTQITHNAFQETPKKELRLCQRLCDYICDCKGIEYGLAYYKILYERLVAAYYTYQTDPKHYFNFFKRYADNLNQCYRADETLLILSKAEGLIDLFPMDTDMRKFILARLENRRSVSYKDIGQEKTALECLNQSIQLADEINAYSILISSYHDMGYLYYQTSEQNLMMHKNWSTAFQIYINHQADKLSMKDKVSSYIHGLLADLVVGKIQDASKKHEVLAELMNHTGMKRYELKIRLTQCLYFTYMQSYPGNFNQILEEAKDQCVFYGYNRDYYKCFYLQAIKCQREARRGQIEQILDNYRMTMDCILSNCRDPRIFTKYIVQLLDIIVQMRLNDGKEYLHEYRKKLKSLSASEELLSVTTMSGSDFREYYNNYVPKTPLFSLDEKMGFPAV